MNQIFIETNLLLIKKLQYEKKHLWNRVFLSIFHINTHQVNNRSIFVLEKKKIK